ncbi:MAG: 4Fe-4S binding protein, partial [Anaerolineaceae bacterium]|nr:4Fe-4S binding protein [Anaerolineaceae bacterium]
MPHFINEHCVGCVLCVHYCPVNAISGTKRQLHIIIPTSGIDGGVCGRVCAFKAVVDAKSQLVFREKPAEWVRPFFDYSICVACNLCNM